MTLKISDNLKKRMNEGNTSRLKLSKNFEENLDITKTGFKIAGDLDTKEELDISSMTLDDIKDYVKRHTAKVKSNYVAGEGGAIIVPFSQFVEMINDGYEIYKSEVLNKMFISIEYQKEMKKDKSR